MMKTNIRKYLVLACCAVLLVCMSVGATLAYLTSTDEVTNTFTVGNIVITLDEADVETDGTVIAGAARVDTNAYHLVPGHEYAKDPTIHVQAGSDNCYLFVKVVNGIADVEAAGETTIAAQMTAKGWVKLTEGSNVWYLTATTENEDGTTTVAPKVDNAGTNPVVFEKFVIANNADLAKVNTTTDKVVVTAYAVQADGFATPEAAWNATFGAQP